jgi:predicted TIM-barrel fold metal-dependent hydrolase
MGIYDMSIKINIDNSDFYSMDDFEIIDKIDMHLHINSLDLTLIKQAQKDNFKLLTVNADYSEFPPVNGQKKLAISLLTIYPQRVAYASTFSMNGWDKPGWQEKTIEYIDKAISNGACAIKVWKNVGMQFRNMNGKLVMIDDPKFDRIFSHLREKGIPLIGHLGEPRDCWLPPDKIMVKYIRDYFIDHPQYHMYLQPEMPTYEDQMSARDNMLEKNKDLVFVGAHLASIEWSVVELARFLDRFPHAVVDTAARVGDLQYQTIKNREIVRDFFIKYQDRVLYATDIIQGPVIDAVKFGRDVHNQWKSEWKYFCTDSTFKVADLDEPIKGLSLPCKVIDKIYKLNAKRIFPKAW